MDEERASVTLKELVWTFDINVSKNSTFSMPIKSQKNNTNSNKEIVKAKYHF